MADFSRDDIIKDPFSSENTARELSLFGVPLFTTYLRVLSIVTLVVSVVYWMRMLGLQGPHLIDLFVEDNHTAIVDGILVVVLPALAVGLWLATSWGYFLWGLASVGLIFTHFAIEPVRYNQYLLGACLTVLLLFYASAGLLSWVSKIRLNTARNNQE